MFQLYNLFLFLSIPFVYLRLLLKSLKFPAYRHRVRERFAKGSNLAKANIWIHAVSLGEVIAVSPLIEALIDKGYCLMVTTTTPTGSKKLLDRFANQIQHQYLPYDLPNLQRHFLSQIQPTLILLMETEIWPNLIMEAKKNAIPIAIINARLSERSLHGYNKISKLMTPVLKSIDAILAQSDDDAHRFRLLAKNDNLPDIRVLGNIKFDQPSSIDTPNHSMLILQKRWGGDRPVLILASTHEDEEKKVIKHLRIIKKACPDLLVLVAPRHPERFKPIFEQIKKFGFVTYNRSKPESVHSDAEIIIIDCVGELFQWYSFASVAFVGGSLVPVGGHNILEPVILGIPVVTGSYLHNFSHISKLLIDKQAMISTYNTSSLIESIITLLTNEDKRKRMADAASQVLLDNRGALQCYQRWIETKLKGIQA